MHIFLSPDDPIVQEMRNAVRITQQLVQVILKEEHQVKTELLALEASTQKVIADATPLVASVNALLAIIAANVAPETLSADEKAALDGIETQAAATSASMEAAQTAAAAAVAAANTAPPAAAKSDL